MSICPDGKEINILTKKQMVVNIIRMPRSHAMFPRRTLNTFFPKFGAATTITRMLIHQISIIPSPSYHRQNDHIFFTRAAIRQNDNLLNATLNRHSVVPHLPKPLLGKVNKINSNKRIWGMVWLRCISLRSFCFCFCFCFFNLGGCHSIHLYLL